MAMMWIFLTLLAFGIGLAVWTFVAPADGRRARDILAVRLARGEVSPDEYRERLSLMSGDDRRSRRRSIVPLGVALIVLGLVGAVAAGGIAMERATWGG